MTLKRPVPQLSKLQHRILRVATVALITTALTIGPAHAELNQAVLPVSGPLSKQTMSKLMLTDAQRVGNRVVAVGDRGYVVYTDNNGDTWERAKSPSGLPLLNGVRFSDAKIGWAVGHDAVILQTGDEGRTWTMAFSAPSEQKPLMDIGFVDANVGYAVGAYGAFYETGDGGKTWNPRKIQEEDKHLNAIIKLGEQKFLIVGEAGTLLRSDDSGKTWNALPAPYKGSFFGAIQATDGSVVIYGLRGRIFRSADASLKEWKQVENKSSATLMGATRLPDGAIVLAGLAGTALVSRDHGESFVPLSTGTTKALAAPTLGAPNAVLLVGENGARSAALPSAQAAAGDAASPAKSVQTSAVTNSK